MVLASSMIPEGSVRPKFVPLRRRRVVSPIQRGMLLGVVFATWICLSHFYFRPQMEAENEPTWKGSRSLLNVTESDDGDFEADGELKPGHCMPPAIEQFPEPILNKTQRRYGGLIFHIALAIYMFIGLAIVCDDFFVPALEKLAEVLNLPPDVAGATFMAAGSSGPELATALIGVFVAKDDIGVSGVIGSAVFNITLVIAVCALAAEQVLFLNWYSVVRDCTCYLISITVLLFTIANEVISWPEALFFLILYVAYCVGMAFNSHIEVLVRSKLRVPESWNVTKPPPSAANVDGGTGADKQDDLESGYGRMDGKKTNGTKGEEFVELPLSPTNPDTKAPAAHAVEPIENPLEKPMDGNMLKLVKYYLLFPLYFLCKYTIPDCRTDQFARLYVLTFVVAIIWISVYSYFMVWMITVIGFTLAIPDTVMGLTFIAAGVSVPDALSGVAVVKEGHGDMAVSNAIGSNVFDILVCLGLPWFLDTAIVNPGTYVRVRSRGLIYSTFSLFSTVVFLIVASHINGWKLDKKFGIILLVWYFIFMLIASLYELNIFGEFNPPECESNY
ncbi:probable sodium/potassium/calcium exchanger CG1090 isoform X2 [Tigriopus californicus]|uniref:probable sodium/potassium/calcium exchanger CG1090 isoform X2 n=1 Tax=Tigriopus californicus TaxID=6832 RepID=UPI0027DA6A89|nr:probable sodium/potassium/calcium exchanger CG1090 isoform X2 [Tigriopus californicus]